MSVAIPRSMVTADLVQQITAALLIPKINTGSPYGGGDSTIETSVRCWSIDSKHLRLPYASADALFPEFVSEQLGEKAYPSMKPKSLASHLKLRENEDYDQQTVVTEAMKHLENKGTVLLNCFPGFGKTLMTSVLCVSCGLKVLVLADKTALHKQWAKTFRENVPGVRVCIVKDDVASIAKAQSKWAKKTRKNDDDDYEEQQPTIHDYDVYISTAQSLPKIQATLDNIGTLVIDECHEWCASMRVAAILSTTPRFVIACSASLQFRNDGLEKCAFAVIGRSSTIVRRIKKPFYILRHTTNVKTPFHELKQKYHRPGQRVMADFAKISKDIFEHEERNDMIVDWVKKNWRKHKMMILTRSRDHAAYLHHRLHSTLDTRVGLYMGNIKKYKDCRVLIGTYSKIGTGFDAATAGDEWDGVHFDMMVMASSVKQMGWLEQLCGRVFRANLPIIVDMVDALSLFINHWKVRRRWYGFYENARLAEIRIPLAIDENVLKEIDMIVIPPTATAAAVMDVDADDNIDDGDNIDEDGNPKDDDADDDEELSTKNMVDGDVELVELPDGSFGFEIVERKKTTAEPSKASSSRSPPQKPKQPKDTKSTPPATAPITTAAPAPVAPTAQTTKARGLITEKHQFAARPTFTFEPKTFGRK
jgi:hypothetical protein